MEGTPPPEVAPELRHSNNVAVIRKLVDVDIIHDIDPRDATVPGEPRAQRVFIRLEAELL
jgi:hypothetical protein